MWASKNSINQKFLKVKFSGHLQNKSIFWATITIDIFFSLPPEVIVIMMVISLQQAWRVRKIQCAPKANWTVELRELYRLLMSQFQHTDGFHYTKEISHQFCNNQCVLDDHTEIKGLQNYPCAMPFIRLSQKFHTETFTIFNIYLAS